MSDSSYETSNFEIGDIVTLKSHPLAYQPGGLIDAYVNQIPPFMCVKEVHFEKKKKKFSADVQDIQIADNTKYLCVYFNQYRMIFEEKMIYESMLIDIGDLLFHREDDKPNDEEYQSLIEETKQFKPLNEYEYGKLVFFKTYKLEKRKKYNSIGIDLNSPKKSAVLHTTPAFILNGYKQNDNKSISDEKTGRPVRKTAEILYKVLWYNSYQEKMSEEYLPKEFLTDEKKIYENSNKSKEDNTYKKVKSEEK
jgi:hypothetical protein